jgi:hypothetical protein
MLGKSEKELLAYDEYDSEGSGKWFTDNPIMANEYYIQAEIWLQFTNEEAAKWKKDHCQETSGKDG